MKTFLTVLCMLASSAGATVKSQTNPWRVQSPCDKSFTVRVPVHLYEVSWFEGKHGPSIEPEDGWDKGGRAFVALQGTPRRRQFGVVVQDVPRHERHLLEKRDFGGLYFVIGGDDATPTTEKTIHVNGLIGREYIYSNAISEDTYTRGRIFYAAGRIYIIVFVGTSAEDLTSADADRFLNSFRVRRRRVS